MIGVDIAECIDPAGITSRKRINGLRPGIPGLIHPLGIKPWTKDPCPPALELKASSLRHSPAAKIMAAIMFSNAILQEFPLSLIDAAARGQRRWHKVARYLLHEDFCLHHFPLI
jgi:hypothetical protein